MINCKQCPDRLKCLTGDVKECRRGFMLKRCCRQYLTSRRKKLLRTILNMPEEMVKNNIIEIREVCGACGEKINFSIRIKPGLDVFPTAPFSPTLPDPPNPNIQPYILPNQPYVYPDRDSTAPWQFPDIGNVTFADDNTVGITLRAEGMIKKGTYEPITTKGVIKDGT